MTTYTQMVALGSSFAAGPGIEPVTNRLAKRSGRNYAHLVAESLGTDLVDATVSGATTATILNSSQRVGRQKFAPQINAVHAGADLVTITAGGNDLGYIGGVLGHAVLHRIERLRLLRPAVRWLASRYPLTDVTPDRARNATDGLVGIVDAVRRKAPGARVILVGYLPLFGADTVAGEGNPFDADELAHFRRTADTLSRVFADAASESGADVVNAADYDQRHTLGTSEPWVFGLRPIRSVASSFHPTPAGMRAVAALLVAHLTETHPEGPD